MCSSLITLIAELSLLQVDFGSQRSEVLIETLLPLERQVGVVDVERLIVDVIPSVLQEGYGARFIEAWWLLRSSVNVRVLSQGIHRVPAAFSLWLVGAWVVLLTCNRVKFSVKQALSSILVDCVFAGDTCLE